MSILSTINRFNLFPFYLKNEARLTGIECFVSTLFVVLLIVYLVIQIRSYEKSDFLNTTTNIVTTTEVGTDTDPYFNILGYRKYYEQTLPFEIEITTNIQRSYDDIFISSNYAREPTWDEWEEEANTGDRSGSITGCGHAYFKADEIINGYTNSGSNEQTPVRKINIPCSGNRYNGSLWNINSPCQDITYKHIAFACPDTAAEKRFYIRQLSDSCSRCLSNYVNYTNNRGYKWEPPEGLSISVVKGTEFSNFWTYLTNVSAEDDNATLPKQAVKITPLKPSWMDWVQYQRDCNSNSVGCQTDSGYDIADFPTYIYAEMGKRYIVGYTVDETIYEHLNGSIFKYYKVFMSSYIELGSDPDLGQAGWFIHIRRENSFISRYKESAVFDMLSNVGGAIPLLNGFCVGVLFMAFLIKANCLDKKSSHNTTDIKPENQNKNNNNKNENNKNENNNNQKTSNGFEVPQNDEQVRQLYGVDYEA